MPTILRLAEPDDLDALTACQTACWAETFTGLVSPEHLHGPDFERARRDEWAERLEAGIAVWLADVEGEIVGFSCGGPSRDPEPPTQMELYTLYTRAAVHGRGLADRLLDAAIGTESASLWVWRDNARARAYYTRRGFVPDGAAKILGTEEAPMVRLVRPAQTP